jgi:uncharacterized protein YbcI
VSVVLAADTLVITLHRTLSEAEKLLGKTPQGAAQLQELHSRLFDGEAEWLREEIKRITGRPGRPSGHLGRNQPGRP